MGIHDYETMNEIRKAINQIDPFYYTVWRRLGFKYTSCSRVGKQIKKCGEMKGIAHFNDNIRDGLKGKVFEEEKWLCKMERKHGRPY